MAQTQQEWVHDVGRYTHEFAIIGTEYGIDDGVGPPEVGWGSGMLSYLVHSAIPAGMNGASAFAWNWVGPDAIISPSSGELSPWGQVVADQLLRAHISS